MPMDLGKTIDSRSAEWQKALDMAQGNILKSHGRDYSAFVLVEFRPHLNPRAQLGKLGLDWITTASQQAAQTQKYLKQVESGTCPEPELFANLFLSVWGYLGLGFTPCELSRAFPHPQNDFRAIVEPSLTNWFLHGMAYHGPHLSDPPRLWWEPQYQGRVDALLLLACNDRATLDLAVGEARRQIEEFGCVRHIEHGKTHRVNDTTLEPFGFADGISQPAFLGAGPLADPEIVFCQDRLAATEHAFGSYLVYRKLEQNVKLFQEEEERLANLLGLKGSDRDRAGAMIVGRFRDGSPIIKTDRPGWQPALDDNFDYSGDPKGMQCPLHSHIRKVRQRPDGKPRLVRRGVPYGSYDPTDAKMARPHKGSGLLFLSFQSNIQAQFGSLQQDWANDPDFEAPNVGKDPIAGQGFSSSAQEWPLTWGKAGTSPCQLRSFVTMKGGEFFFTPSRPFFERLASE
jgi:Dyp-type peroxidase family